MKHHQMVLTICRGKTPVHGFPMQEMTYECRACRSGLKARLNTHVSESDLNKVIREAWIRMDSDFDLSYAKDCEEAARLNVVRSVQES